MIRLTTALLRRSPVQTATEEMRKIVDVTVHLPKCIRQNVFWRSASRENCRVSNPRKRQLELVEFFLQSVTGFPGTFEISIGGRILQQGCHCVCSSRGDVLCGDSHEVCGSLHYAEVSGRERPMNVLQQSWPCGLQDACELSKNFTSPPTLANAEALSRISDPWSMVPLLLCCNRNALA